MAKRTPRRPFKRRHRRIRQRHYTQVPDNEASTYALSALADDITTSHRIRALALDEMHETMVACVVLYDTFGHYCYGDNACPLIRQLCQRPLEGDIMYDRSRLVDALVSLGYKRAKAEKRIRTDVHDPRKTTDRSGR